MYKKEVIKTDRFINYYLLRVNNNDIEGYSVIRGYCYFLDDINYYHWCNERVRDKFYLKRLEYEKEI